MRKRLTNYFKASFPAIAIQTPEEKRAINDVISAAKETNKGVAVWSITEGLAWITPMAKRIDDTQDPNAAFSQRLENCVYILRDVQMFPFERDPMITRNLRDLIEWVPSVGSCVVMIGPSFTPHPTFEKMVVVTDYSLPDVHDLNKIAKGIAESASKKWNGDPDVIRALSGLCTTEAENALALSLIETGKFDPDVIYREKVQGVKKSGLLEIIDPDPRGLDAVGGAFNLKNYIKKRIRAFTDAAIKYGLDIPKGILLVGVPGTGKSLFAKIVGIVFGLPTLRLDIGQLFNSLVGESESRTRAALQICEAQAPCVLWVDEIDKGLAGSSGSGANDSGVTKRVFGTIISWMVERKKTGKMVYLVATANDVTALPPEFLGKHRWDEIFAIDLPTDSEREEIFRIHLEKRNRNPEKFLPDVNLIKATAGFTGSEIESVIIEAMFNSFDEDRELTTKDLIAAANDITPLSITAKEKIDSIRQWAQTRARFASEEEIVSKKSTRKLNLAD